MYAPIIIACSTNPGCCLHVIVSLNICRSFLSTVYAVMVLVSVFVLDISTSKTQPNLLCVLGF